MHSELDGGAERLHYQGAATGSKRGYHVLTFDGPGQPSAIQRHGLVFRPDWEHVVGMSLGGYLAPRAAAFESRLAAVTESLPWDHAEIERRARADHDEDLDQALATMAPK